MPLRRLITGPIARAGLSAGMLAFLVQILAWSVTMPAMALAAVTGAEQGTVITICSSDGFKQVRVGPDGQALPGDASASGEAPGDGGAMAKTGHCPLCPVIGGAGLPPPVLSAQPLFTTVLADERMLPGAVIAAGWFLSTLQARAPPVRA